MQTEQQARDYLLKPYTRTFVPDQESGGFTARIVEFPGCLAEGDTVAEAYERLEAAAESWIEAALHLGQDIPEPASVGHFGGKFALRLPKSLHSQAAHLAALEDVSLNQFIVATLAERVGAMSIYRSLEREFRAVAATLQTTMRVEANTISKRAATAVGSEYSRQAISRRDN